MPFQNLKINIGSLVIGEQDYIEKVMKNVLHECNRYNDLIRIIHSMKGDPTRDKLNPKDFLVFLGLENGLNWAEIQQWLDYASLNRRAEFYFGDLILSEIDERKPYYKTLSGGPRGGRPSYFLKELK